MTIDIFEKLSKSKFRSSFKLKAKDFEYIEKKGLETVESHAHDFITQADEKTHGFNRVDDSPLIF